MGNWRILSVAAWFAFTLSLAVWQAIFSRQTLVQLSHLSPTEGDILARHARMVQAESLTMVLMLVIGGIALTTLIRRERRAAMQLREFFGTFTHELKTSLSSLRIQAEVLQDQLTHAGAGKSAERILGDLTRIDLQLENSLALARGGEEALLSERSSLKELLASLQHSTTLPIHLERDCELMVDRRAMESILKNIAQNAAIHGRAENLHVDVGQATSPDKVVVSIEDDGAGAPVESKSLGRLFHRPMPSSKNGIGLYLVRNLCRRMGGGAEFIPRSRRGFEVRLELPGRIP